MTLKRVLNKIHRCFFKKHDEPLSLSGYEPGIFEFPGINNLSDEELARLNKLLPWSSWVIDSRGRRFGHRFSTDKRNTPEILPDTRIVELNKRFNLSDKHVLEVGCYEGNHTVALSHYSKSILAVDSRIEHVVKTLVRCSMAGFKPTVCCWDIEQPAPADLNLDCDVLHHVGVLYHLAEPARHLKHICKYVRHGLMLDTHVAPDGVKLMKEGDIRYWEFTEHGRDNPFSGMGSHAKWIVLEDLVELLHQLNFTDIDIAERRNERNGPRVLIYASR